MKMKRNNKSNIVNNSIMLMIFHIAKIVFPFVTLPYLTRVLSSDTYGVVTYVKAVMVYMQMLVDFGFVLSGTKDIVKSINNKKQIDIVIGDTLLARTILGIIGLVITIVLSLTLPILRGHVLFTLLSYIVVFETIFLMDFVFRGFEKMHVITIRFIIMKLISTILTFVLIKSDRNLILIPILDIVSSFMAILLVMYELKKMDIHLKISKISNAFIKIKESFIYFLSTIASTSFNVLSTIIIGIYLSKTDVAYWGICMQIIGTIQACYNPITDGIYPEMIRTKNLNIIRKTIKIFIPIVCIGCIIAYIFAPLGIKILGGTQYSRAISLFRILIPCLLIGFLAMLFGWPAVGAIGKPEKVTKSTVLSIIFNILCLILLIITNNFTLINIAIVRVLTEAVLFGIRFYYFTKYKKKFIIYSR